jgi:hypothetical protein
MRKPPAPKRRPTLPVLGRLLRRLGLLRAPGPDDLGRRILLPSLSVSDEEHARAHHLDTGQRLARQEDWEILAARVIEADHRRLHTPAGETVASLLAQGARADLVTAAEDAIADGRAPDGAGLAALEAVLAEDPDSYPLALIVALAHMEIGRAWRAGSDDARTRHRGERAFLEHFARAEALLEPFDPEARDAPSIAAARCALLAARPAPRRRVADDYARLIALDPGAPGPLRALGEALLPERFGSFDELDLEARRASAQTAEIWREGGYAWVWLDALARDPAGLAVVDPAFFCDGLRAIAARCPDQHVINQLAAFCGLVMAPGTGQPRLAPAQERARRMIHACLDWLVAEHLHELHPLVWTQALIGPGQPADLPPRRMLMQRGRQAALRAIAARFADEIAEGQTLAFSSAGMYRLPTP